MSQFAGWESQGLECDTLEALKKPFEAIPLSIDGQEWGSYPKLVSQLPCVILRSATDSSVTSWYSRALNACLGKDSQFRFIDVGVRLSGRGTSRHFKPDIVLVLKGHHQDDDTLRLKLQGKRGWEAILMFVEVQAALCDDPVHWFDQDHSTDPPSGASVYSISQIFKYVQSQWADRPQRHIFHLTVVAKTIRIWRWNPCGTEYTAPLDYMEAAGRSLVATFLASWQQAQPWMRGEDVDPSPILSSPSAHYTFQSFDPGVVQFRYTTPIILPDRITTIQCIFNDLYGSGSPLKTPGTCPPKVYLFNHGALKVGR